MRKQRRMSPTYPTTIWSLLKLTSWNEERTPMDGHVTPWWRETWNYATLNIAAAASKCCCCCVSHKPPLCFVFLHQTRSLACLTQSLLVTKPWLRQWWQADANSCRGLETRTSRECKWHQTHQCLWFGVRLHPEARELHVNLDWETRLQLCKRTASLVFIFWSIMWWICKVI